LAARENPYLNGPGGYGGARPFSEGNAEAIDDEVRTVITESHQEAKRLFTPHRKQPDAVPQALLAGQTLNEKEILEVTGLPPAPPLETEMLPVHDTDGGNASASREDKVPRVAYKA